MPTSREPISLLDDCARCVGLCCVALTFTRSPDFARDKPAGVPCPNLDADFRCRVHATLREVGYSGCDAYSCFGAGPRLTEAFAGGDWRSQPETAARVFAGFPRTRQLHELLWHVRAALAAPLDGALTGGLADAAERIEGVLRAQPSGIAAPARDRLRELTTTLLRRASAQLRGPATGVDLSGADLMGADLRHTDLSRASLRGALLLGADLRGVVLDRTDLTGADLRRVRLDDADLGRALFVTESQLRAARGSVTTVLPPGTARPSSWSA